MQSLQAGEELLRKARSVSHRILERFEKVMGSDRKVSDDTVLLAETFKRLWKVMGADREVREETKLLAETFKRFWKVMDTDKSQQPRPAE